jgi:hypothetical protein
MCKREKPATNSRWGPSLKWEAEWWRQLTALNEEASDFWVLRGLVFWATEVGSASDDPTPTPWWSQFLAQSLFKEWFPPPPCDFENKDNLFCGTGFELKVSHWLGRCSTTWATPPAPFCVGYFPDRVLQIICPGWLWTSILLISGLLSS